MFALKQSICYPGFGRKANEDIIGWGKHYCFAIDGASGLSGKNVIDPISDSAWMVKKVREGLCALLDQEDPRSTQELLLEVIAQVRREYCQALQNMGVTAPEDSPSACVALFRQRGNTLEFFGVGDCVGIAKLPDGANFHSLDTNLPALDQQVLDKMAQICKETGVTMKEARKLCNDQLIQNRNLRNKPEGYWILDLLTDDGIHNARVASWELTQPVCVGTVSDGFAQLTEVFGQYPDYIALLEAMQENDLQEMADHLCAMQDADADCMNYPRFKLRDDTCALWGIFSPESV